MDGCEVWRRLEQTHIVVVRSQDGSMPVVIDRTRGAQEQAFERPAHTAQRTYNDLFMTIVLISNSWSRLE